MNYPKTLGLIILLLVSCQPTATRVPTPEEFNSNLPLTLIASDNAIVDEPKVTANMKIIDSEARNSILDEATFKSQVGIEIRGQSSQYFDKKQYGFETRDSEGENLNTELLGFPEENDWILSAPYSDKSLMRNVIAYGLARDMGHYASRTAYTELFINDEYQGLYLLLEKVKRDKNRVDISKQKDNNLTGGYIIELTQFQKLDPEDQSFVLPIKNRPITYVYPSDDDLSADAAAYISGYVTAFEQALYGEAFTDPVEGYRQYLNVDTAIDYMIIQELFKNVDAFSASMFMYKDEDKKLNFGPVWDFNFSSGNDNYEPRRKPEGWHLKNRIWAEQLLKDPSFTDAYVERWQALEASGVFALALENITLQEAMLSEAQERNFEKWPVLNEVIGYNSPDFVFGSYEQEVAYFRDWFERRIAWLSENMPTLHSDNKEAG